MAHAVQLSSPLFMAAFFPFMPLATIFLVWVTGGGLPSSQEGVGGLLCALGLAVFVVGQARSSAEEESRKMGGEVVHAPLLTEIESEDS